MGSGYNLYKNNKPQTWPCELIFMEAVSTEKNEKFFKTVKFWFGQKTFLDY